MKKQAFTLIELLIVVAIIAILAAIAVPNFLEAQVRSKVSRVKADMRSLATGLEAYFVDNNTYPYRWERPSNPSANMQGISAGVALSTPVSYVTNPRVIDPFVKYQKDQCQKDQSRQDKNYLAFYIGNRGRADRWPKNCFGIVSYGPDGDDDTKFSSFPFGYQGSSTGSNTPGWAGEYDSTNGAKSRGDIFRCQPIPPKQWVMDTGGNIPAGQDPFSY